MGRTSTARERLLAVTCELMESRGYGSLGVAEICAQADVRKGSFYHFFASKQALTLEAVDAHWSEQRAGWIAALRGDAPALDRLNRLFDDMTLTQRRSKESCGVVKGCLLGNLALELSNQEPGVQARLAEIFDEQIDLIKETLDEGAAEGVIPRDSATRATARSLIAQLEGAVMLAKLANDPGLLDDLWPRTRLLLRANAASPVTEPPARPAEARA